MYILNPLTNIFVTRVPVSLFEHVLTTHITVILSYEQISISHAQGWQSVDQTFITVAAFFWTETHCCSCARADGGDTWTIYTQCIGIPVTRAYIHFICTVGSYPAIRIIWTVIPSICAGTVNPLFISRQHILKVLACHSGLPSRCSYTVCRHSCHWAYIHTT